MKTMKIETLAPTPTLGALAARVLEQAAAQARVDTCFHLPHARLAVAQRLAREPQGPDDALWDELPDAGAFFDDRETGAFADSTRAWVAFDDACLYVRFACAGAPARPNFEKSYYRADSVEVFLDAAHDHHHYLQFAITAGGHATLMRSSRPLDSQRWEQKRKAEELGAEGWRGTASADGTGWRALFAIPFERLGGPPAEGRPLGFNLLRARKDGTFAIHRWNETHAGPHAPWGFGELVLGAPPAVHVEEVDLGEDVKLWENRGALFVRNLAGTPLRVRLEVRVACLEDESEAFHRAETDVNLAAEGLTRVPLAFPLDPEDYKWQHLSLALRDAGGAALWGATYRFGRGQGLLLQLDDRRETPAPNPRPGEPGFMQQKRRYILCRLPRFARKTTAQGAPSDFTLEARDGSVRFDLMEAGALKRIADWIYARFETDTDRLLAANFFVHQTAVMRYANVPTALSTQLSSLSILRMGCGQCCAFAAALAGLLEHLRCEATGRTYRATRVGVPGHVTTVAEFGGKWVHLDPSVGRFYFLRDDKTLASMEDLLADPSLAARAGKYLEAFHRKASEDPEAPIFYRPERGVWPSGAPEA
ncbi:MAG: hypothetical protein M5U26_18060 [Planctomycetota bacterium]|nr:hypothetical protein [Planctomycetota bacterium]